MSVNKASLIEISESIIKHAQQIETSYTQQLDQEVGSIYERYEVFRRKAALEREPQQRRSLYKDINTRESDELDAADDLVLKRIILDLQKTFKFASMQLQKMVSNVDMRQSLRQESVVPTLTVDWMDRIQESVEQPEIDANMGSEPASCTNGMPSSQSEPTNLTNHTETPPPIAPGAPLPTTPTASAPHHQPTEVNCSKDGTSETQSATLPQNQHQSVEQQALRPEEPQRSTPQQEELSNEGPRAQQGQPIAATPVSASHEDASVSRITPTTGGLPGVGGTPLLESPRLRRTFRAANVFNTRTSRKRPSDSTAYRPILPKRQRSSTASDSPLTSLSTTFDDVYQNGQALKKREILKHGDYFYFVECKEHSETYDGRTNSFKAASKHFRGEKHRFENKVENAGAFNIIIPRFGVHVRDCTDAKAATNNRMLHRALAVAVDLHQDGGPRGPERGLSRPTIAEMNAILPKTLKPWGLYAGFVSNFLRPIPVVVLPVVGTISSIGLELEHKDAYLKGLPDCVKYDEKSTVLLGWADGYRDGQPKEHQRQYPVLGFKGINYPKNIIMQWTTIDELCALPFDRHNTGDHVRQRKDALWFASTQRRIAPAGAARPQTASSVTTPELETEIPSLITSPVPTDASEEQDTSMIVTAGAPTQNTVSQDDEADGYGSEGDLPTIEELISSPDTPKHRDALKRFGREVSPAETVRARLADMDANKRTLPHHTKPTELRDLGDSSYAPQSAGQEQADTTRSSWFTQQLPPSGRAAQPVMGYPTRPSPAEDLYNPRVSKKSTNSRFMIKSARKMIVKFRVSPHALRQIHHT